MRNYILTLLFIAIPLFVLANGSFLQNHQHNSGQNPLLQNDRTYRIMHRTYYTWDETDLEWNNMFNYGYHYVPNNPTNPDSITFYFWNSNAAAYSRIGVYIITYNNTGELITNIDMYMNMGQTVTHYQDMNFTYNAQGYMTGYDMSMYNQMSGTMQPYGWMKINYVSTSNYEVWNWYAQNDDYVPEWSHTTFQWDAQGRITTETIVASPDSVNWDNDEQITHEYQPWDTTTGTSFVNNFSHQVPLSMLNEDAGPSFGNQTQSISSSWTGNWVNDTKYTWTYDANHRLISDMEYRWLSSYWSEDWKHDYTYDINNNLIEVIYANMGATWVNHDRTTYEWSNITDNSDETSTPQVQIIKAYPNPVNQSEAIIFETKLSANETGSLDVYNLKGQKVKSFVINAKSSGFTWNNRDENNQACAAGIYFYRLSTNKHVETNKLVILK